MKQEARFFKSLADETRLQILWLLLEREELCVCDIMAVLGITQSKASRHLRYLFNQGLCGYATCMAYAAALREGEISLNDCPPPQGEPHREKRLQLQTYLESFGWRALDGDCRQHQAVGA